MKLVTKIGAIFDGALKCLALLAAVLLVFTMLGTAAEVTVRYLLGGSIKWMFETVQYSLLFITFLGAAWLLKGEGHVLMDIILRRLKPTTQALFNMVTSILGALVCLVVARYSAQVTWDLFQSGTYERTVLEPPSFILYAVIPVGSFLLFIQFLKRACTYLANRKASPNQEQRS